MTNDIKQINTADNQGHGLHLDSTIMTYIYEGGTRTVKWILDKIFELLNGKANTATTYTKTEVDTALSGKSNIANPSFNGHIHINETDEQTPYLAGDDGLVIQDSPNADCSITLSDGGNITLVADEHITLNSDVIDGSAIADTIDKLNAGGERIPNAHVVVTALAGKANSTHTHNANEIRWYTSVSPSGYYDLSVMMSSLTSMIEDKENTSNKVTSLTSSSTDTQYPSAKCVYDELQAIKARLTALES